MKSIEIESERLILEEIKKKYITDKYLSWLKDKYITKYLEVNFEEYTIEKLEKYVYEKINSKNCILYAILVKENNEKIHIGNIKLEPINFIKKNVILGIMIGDINYHRKGIGYETIILIINFLKKNNFKKIYLGVSEYNINALNLYKKIGFKVINNDDTPLGIKKENQIRMEYIISP